MGLKQIKETVGRLVKLPEPKIKRKKKAVGRLVML